MFGRSADTGQDTATQYDVPEHLAEYYDQAPGLTEIERAEFLVNGGVEFRDVSLYSRGVSDPEQRPPIRLTDLGLWEHQRKIEQAEKAWKAEQFKATIPKPAPCPLCAEDMWPHERALVQIGDRSVTVHVGRCAELLQLEIHRRRHADTLDRLLA